MKKVLIIAYQFPPMGGSGVQRTSKFVKYLRDFGWEPVVFTRQVGKMPLKDESLLKDIPAGVKVIRTHPWDLTELPGILGLAGKVASRKILIPDGERLWQVFSKSRAMKALYEEAIDLVYTTSYPYSDHLLGACLKKACPEIPWVADFRDEWTNNPYLLDNPHYGLRMKRERAMEKQVLLKADQLITNTPVMQANFIREDKGLEEKFHVIPNGFDREDFEGLPDTLPENSRFTLSYTGALYGRRKPDVVFEALKRLIDGNRIHREKIRVKLIGNYKTGALNALVEKYELSGIVEILPYMKHRECLLELAGSDALLLIEGAGPGAEAFYTGKVFEYMNTGRPILAAIPSRGAAAGLIRETRTGIVSDCTDVEGTAENIYRLYAEWEQKQSSYHPDREKIAGFERKSLTGRLAGVFEKALQNKPTGGMHL